MLWIIENRKMIRALSLLVFVAAMLGTWMFDTLYVPAAYDCSAPTVRLEGDFCGWPMSGLKTFTLFGLGMLGTVGQLLTRTYPSDQGPRLAEYFAGLIFIFPLFPFLNNLLIMRRPESRRLQMTSLIFWATACALSLPLLFFSLGPQTSKLWGLWMYVGLTLCMTLFEVLIRKSSLRT